MKNCRAIFGPNVVVVGDPVDVVTGANLDRQTDFVLAGPLPLPWYRWYDSGDSDVPGELGWGHRHEYERRLLFDLDGCRHVGPTGGAVAFPPLERDGDSFAADGLRLVRENAKRYTAHSPGEPAATFEVIDGRPTAVLTALHRGEHRIQFRYDRDARLSGVIDSKGRSIRVDHDGYGRLARLSMSGANGQTKQLAEYQYDAAGNLVKMTDPYRNSVRLRWDAANRVVWRADRRGYAFRFEYDGQGRCVLAGGEDGTDEVRLAYSPPEQLTRVTHRDGGVWVYRYDDTGVVTSVTAPDGGVRKHVKDEAGRVGEEVDPLGNVTRRLFDASGVEVGHIDPFDTVSNFEDDTPGLPAPAAPEDPAGWDYGDLLILPPEPSSQPTPETDEFGLLVRETFPDGTDRRYHYDPNGNTVKYTDREGRVSTSEYASWNLLAGEADAAGRVRYEYAPHRHTTAVTDAGGTRSEYGYDRNERLTEVRRHGVVKETYRYDAAGNLIEKRDGDGNVLLTFDIGPKNLPLKRTLASGEVHEFGYDAAGQYMTAKASGCEVKFAYDDAGLRVADLRDGCGVRHTFGPNGFAETVALDKFVTVLEWATTQQFDLIDPTGGRHTIRMSDDGTASRRLANGTVEVSRYGDGGRCLERARTGRGDGWVRRYRYSPEGDLAAVSDSLYGDTTYQYDAAHRLIGVQRDGESVQPIDLDPAGNILRMPGVSGVQMLDGNRLLAANGERFEYDRRNHVSVRTSGSKEARYHYDSLDQLVRVERTGEPDWTAAYDPLGRRVWKAWGGRRVEYFWDTDRLIAERDETGLLRVYVYADAFALVPVLFVEYPSADADPADGKRYYVFADQIGTPTRVEDAAGEVVWSAVIDPYGRAAVDPASRIDFAFRFPGHWHDAETGLHYNRFRYYDPALGRYVQADPIGTAGGLNLYAYGDTSPLTVVDVDGLRPKKGRGKIRNCPSSVPEQGPVWDPQAIRVREGVYKGDYRPRVPRVKREKRRKGETARDAAERKAKEMEQDYRERGQTPPPMVTVVRDKRTGKTYTASPGEHAPGDAPLSPPAAHPQTGMPEGGQYQPEAGRATSATTDQNTRPVGNCGEAKAIDAALQDGSRKKDLEVATVAVQQGEGDRRGVGTGAPVECCPNCKVTTRGTDKVQTDPE